MMRIINLNSTDKYVAEANKTLKPGEATRELQLSLLLTTPLMTLVARKQLAIRLSAEDKAVLADIAAADAAKLPEIKGLAVVTPAQQRREVEAIRKQRRAAAEAKAQAKAPKPAVNPACVGGQPAYAQLGAAAAALPIDGKPTSLAQAKAHNQAVAAQKKEALKAARSLLGGLV